MLYLNMCLGLNSFMESKRQKITKKSKINISWLYGLYQNFIFLNVKGKIPRPYINCNELN